MTIDESIESLKSDYEIDMYIRDIAPQLAEWLEELKEYKSTNYPKCSECAGCTQWNCDCANVRNKAIDDLVLQCKKVHARGLITNWGKPFGIEFDKLDEIAQQLKAGDVE